MLADVDKELDMVIEIEVDDEKMVERISGRFTCAGCGEGYNDVFKNPQVEGKCDKCDSGEFKRRDDDKAETVAARLKTYHDQTAPLIPYYREKGQIFGINGMADIDDVTKSIDNLLKRLT